MKNLIIGFLLVILLSCDNSEQEVSKTAISTSVDSVQMKAYIDSADYYFRQAKNLEIARAMFDSAYRLGFSKEQYQYNIGYLYYHESEFLRASLFFEEALKENPDVAKYHLRLAECYYFLNEPELLVKSTLKKGLDLGGKYPPNLPPNYLTKKEK